MRLTRLGKLPGSGTFAITALTFCALAPASAWGQQITDLRRLNLPRWTLERELRLGSVEGEHDAFVHPLLKVDAEGRLYVGDSGIPAVRVFERDGTYSHQLGRKGMGPGEYTMPVSFGFLRDTVWVIDGVTRRVSLFNRNGQFIGDIGLERDRPGVEPPMPMDVLGLDDFLVVDPPGPDKFFRGHGVGRVTFRQSIMRRNRSGSRSDTLVTYSAESPFIITQADVEGFSVVPYRGISQTVVSSYNAEYNEVIQVERPVAAQPDAGEFRVTIRRPNGTVMADRHFRYQPVAVPKSVKDSIRSDMESKYRGARVPLGAQKQLAVALKYLAIPDFLPPVSVPAVVRGKDGLRWIARESFTGLNPTHYLITDAALNPVATLALPPTALFLTGPRTRDYVWAIEQDEFDVQYLVRYRIRGN